MLSKCEFLGYDIIVVMIWSFFKLDIFFEQIIGLDRHGCDLGLVVKELDEERYL